MKKDPNIPYMVACMTVGTVIIYVFGVLQLMNWTKIDLNEAIILGVLPFIVGDALKMSAASYITSRIIRTLPSGISSNN